MKKETKEVNKEWGKEIWFANNSLHNYCGKILQINEGKSTSLHYHLNKHETFYVLEGTLRIETVNTEDTSTDFVILHEGDTFSVDIGVPHRLAAHDEFVEFIEVSTYHMDSDSHRISR